MFLIQGSYGEYDDFNRLPILIVPDEDTAIMVVEEMQRPDNQFLPLIKEIFYVPHEDIGFSYEKIQYFTLE